MADGRHPCERGVELRLGLADVDDAVYETEAPRDLELRQRIKTAIDSTYGEMLETTERLREVLDRLEMATSSRREGRPSIGPARTDDGRLLSRIGFPHLILSGLYPSYRGPEVAHTTLSLGKCKVGSSSRRLQADRWECMPRPKSRH